MSGTLESTRRLLYKSQNCLKSRPLLYNHGQRLLFSTTPRAEADASAKTNTLLVTVPEEHAYIVERFGRYSRTLEAGLAILVPVIDKVPYSKSLKERAMPVPPQQAVTSDSVPVQVDGIIYTKISDAYKSCYGVDDVDYAIQELTQTTMRQEVAKLTLEEVLRSRALLGTKIAQVVNDAANEAWGTQCLRYEIRDVLPPRSVVLAMQRAAVEKLFPES